MRWLLFYHLCDDGSWTDQGTEKTVYWTKPDQSSNHQMYLMRRAFKDGWKDGCMDERMDGRMDAWMDGWRDGY